MHNAELAAHISALSDEDLTRRVASGGFTDVAQDLALAELTQRGLPIPALNVSGADEEPYLGDMLILERDLAPTDAHIVCSLLNSAGIAASAGDTNLVQAHSLLAIALGGVRIRVPASQLEDAKALLAAYERGEFALGDDCDVESPEA